MTTEPQSTASEHEFWTKSSVIQLGYGVWVSTGMVIVGLAFGFPAVTIPQLRETDSKIKVTISDESWIVSVLTLISPVGCILGGYLIDKFGRRVMLIYCQVPLCLGWLFTGLANSAKQIIIGRLITGLGLGMVTSIPRVYITEISVPKIRGVLGSIPNVAISIGITLQATLGSLFKWHVLCFIGSVYSLILFFANLGLPETPYYLLNKSSPEHAKTSLKRLRSKGHDIDAEMEKLVEFKRENDIRKLNTKEQIFMLFKLSSCKPFWLITIYFAVTQSSGITVIAMWTVEILKNSKSSVDEHLGNVIMGFTRLVAGVITSILMFRVKRRVMGLTSSFGVGIACIVITFLIRYCEKPTVLPLFFYSAYIFFAACGHYTLPIVMMYELYPLQIRGIMGGISMSTLNIFISLTNWSYPYVRDSIGLANTISCFAACSLLGCVYLYIFLPETQGLTLHQTETYYQNR